jgi:hypothetical protein
LTLARPGGHHQWPASSNLDPIGERMTRTIDLPRAVAAGLLAATLGGCATGRVGPLPPVTNAYHAANVTVFRDGSWTGLFAPITLRIEGHKTYRVGRNEQFTFKLDPGEYVFDYTIGFNECRRIALVYAGQSYRYRLAPNCARFDWGW